MRQNPRPPHALGSPTPGVVSLRNLALVRGGLCWLVLWKGVEMVDKITGRRVVAADPLIGDDRYDYADAFEVVLDDTDPRTPEALVRAGLEHAPTVLRYAIIAVHRWILRLRLAPTGTGGDVLGWMVTHSYLDVVALQAGGPLLDATMIARRAEPTRAVLTTFVFYRHPMLGKVVWSIVGPVHRAIAPMLLRRAARTTTT